jgi:hypothetical protein
MTVALVLSSPLAAQVRDDRGVAILHATQQELRMSVRTPSGLFSLTKGSYVPADPDVRVVTYQRENLRALVWTVTVLLPEGTELFGITTKAEGDRSNAVVCQTDDATVDMHVPSIAKAHIREWSAGRAVVDVDLTVALTEGDTTIVRTAFDVVLALRPARGKSPNKEAERVQNVPRLGSVYRIPVERTGIYRISAETLRNAGIGTDAATARTLRLFGTGGLPLRESMVELDRAANLIEQPIIVNTNSDGTIRDIEFFGVSTRGFERAQFNRISHFLNPYANQGAYILATSSSEGLRATPKAPPSGDAQRATSAVTGVFWEEDVVNPYNDGSGRRWFGKSIENGGSVTITTQLPGLRPGDTIQYVLASAHRDGTSPDAGVHTMTFTEQGTPLAREQLRNIPEYIDMYFDSTHAVLPSNRLADSRSVIRATYQSANRNASGNLDYIEIQYPRELVAHDNTFEFWSRPNQTGITEWMINGFSGSILGFDVTDLTSPVLVQNSATTGGIFRLVDSIASGQRRQYFVSGSRIDARLDRIPWENLRTDFGPFNAIVLADESHLESAREYAAYRSTVDNLRVGVVSVQQVLREFSSGNTDPTAIRAFLRFAYRTWSTKPGYVVFWGDSHFDYRGISTSAPNFIMTYQGPEPDAPTSGTRSFSTDDYFVRIDGGDNDRAPDMAIGRLPVTSNDVGRKLLAKIRSYEEQAATDDWRTRILLIADDSEGDPNKSPEQTLHSGQSEELDSTAIPSDLITSKVYMAAYSPENVPRGRRKPGATQDILSNVNTTGSLVVNWVGHGNPRVWAHENIFVRETTIPQMTNRTKPFFLTAATCDFARFDMANIQSGAEELLLSEIGGAIGVFSASRVVFSINNAALNRAFYRELWAKEPDGHYPRLGDALLRTKAIYNSDNDEKFLLLGDPLLRLLAPDHPLRFDSVNSVSLTDQGSKAQLRALDRVLVTGAIMRRGTTDEIDSTFTGVATISLFDADMRMAVVDSDRNRTVTPFVVNGANLTRTSAQVYKGRFTAEFVIPRDIAYSELPGRLFGFAASTDRRFARGAARNVFVNGLSDDQYDDIDGPSMAIYMDSRRFKPGDIVRDNPILIVDLQDGTGINVTGVGVGHNLEAKINDGAFIENLTSSFTTSLENPRAGTATRQLFGLPKGLHSIRVRAWDVLNNVSEAETSFRIIDDAGSDVAQELQANPNPFSASTLITFKHTIDKPFVATMSVMTLDGRLVYSDQRPIEAMQTAEIPWSGRDTNGDVLPSGIYTVVVKCALADGSVVWVGGKVSLVR